MKTLEINSPHNATFKRLLRYKNPRDIRKHEKALLSGPKQIREVLREFPNRCAGIIFSGKQENTVFQETDAIPRYALKPDLFRQLDSFGTKHPLLIVHAEALPPFGGTLNSAGCTLCIPFQDPGNVGAVIRTAAAFGVARIVLLKEAAHPFHPKSIRVAGSSIFRTPLFQGPSLKGLMRFEIPLILMSSKGKDVARFEFPDRFCLVPGLEGPGLPEIPKGAATVSIPMSKGVESLNAATATGIVLYLWRNRKLHSAMVGAQRKMPGAKPRRKNTKIKARKTSC